MSNTPTIDQVREFSDAFGLEDHLAKAPVVPEPQVGLMRIQMLAEEVAELAHALGKRDVTGVLDALVDIQYFLDGTFLACGMAAIKEEAFAEVHRSNMSKLDENGKPIRDESGRVVKGPNYSPPILKPIITAAWQEHITAAWQEQERKWGI